MSPAPVVIAPSFPRRADASDGQSVYVVEAAHALARTLDAPLHAIALRLGDEPPEERDGALWIHRIEPDTSIPGPFALYEATHFTQTMAQLAEDAPRRCCCTATSSVPRRRGSRRAGTAWSRCCTTCSRRRPSTTSPAPTTRFVVP